MNAISSQPHRSGRWPAWARVLAWCFGIFLVLQVITTLGIRGLAAKYGGSEPLQARIQMRGFATTLAMRKVVGLDYPSTLEGLAAAFKNEPRYLPKMSSASLADKLKDPWGHAFVYYCPGSHNRDSYDLLSLGEDGREGTSDDITNW